MITQMDFDACTENEVQQEYLKQLNTMYETHTDDIYDNANFVAALRKMAILVIQDTIAFADKEKMPEGTTENIMRCAFKDWDGWTEEMDKGTHTFTPQS